ncbi:hypothetical protein EVAR_69919_1 [Eumeta japonica]|uniref:Uncharacterized protein n=1 Tax=Eumeta variegata TaxID=151549 RepID=A0A4C2AFW0_EUMVA|nr:hypothetical protein EVAR_69919_1 [Eumeta japonica]
MPFKILIAKHTKDIENVCTQVALWPNALVLERVLDILLLRGISPKRPTDPPPAADDYQPTEQCPEPNGFYPSNEQCDKYNACV